jgi:hypothetical protein
MLACSEQAVFFIYFSFSFLLVIYFLKTLVFHNSWYSSVFTLIITKRLFLKYLLKVFLYCKGGSSMDLCKAREVYTQRNVNPEGPGAQGPWLNPGKFSTQPEPTK